MPRPALLLSLVLFGLEVAADPVAARDFKITFSNKTEKELDYLHVTNDLNDEDVIWRQKGRNPWEQSCPGGQKRDAHIYS